ncbi:MAG: YcaO-like family protein [Chloroflexota bacterium]|nr:YcaO-like family protein [Chloroflexota bacterium]
MRWGNHDVDWSLLSNKSEAIDPLYQAAPLIDKRLGPITSVRTHRVSNDYAYLHVVTASVRDPAGPNNEPLAEIIAAGGGLTNTRARSAAIGEAIERLSLSRFQPEQAASPTTSGPANRSIKCCYDELKGEGVNPQSLIHYPTTIYNQPAISLQPYDPTMPLYWVKGHYLSDMRPVWVPCFSVYTRYSVGQDSYFDAVVSTGGACDHEWQKAVISGLYEVVERDAFTIHWENRWPTEPLTIPPTMEEVALSLQKNGFKLFVGQLATDTGIPVALAAVIDESGGKRAALGLGAAARATPEAAAYRAIEEALLTSFWVTTLLQISPLTLNQLRFWMNGLPEPSIHAHLYGFPQMREQASFFWANHQMGIGNQVSGVGDQVTGIGDGYRGRIISDTQHLTPDTLSDTQHLTPDTLERSTEMNWLLERIRSTGAEPIVVDVTAEEARRCGFVVVRVLIPSFVPLGRGVKVRPLTNQRLRSVPEWFGRKSLADSGFNPDPHPFP